MTLCSCTLKYLHSDLVFRTCPLFKEILRGRRIENLVTEENANILLLV